MKLLGCFSAAFATAMVALGQTAAAFDPPYVLSGAIAPPAGDKITSFDISFVDPVLNRYYIASRTSKAVIAVDTRTLAIVGNFKPGFAGFTGSNDTSGPDGVTVVDHKEIWVGDAPSRVWVLDALTGAPVAGFTNPISTGPSAFRADEGCYDPVDKIAAFVNNADSPPFITFFSTTTHSVLGTVVFDGTGGTPNATNGAEQCAWNPRDGKIYLSLPEIGGAGDNSSPGGVVVFDPTTRAILRTMIIPMAACTGPQGLAIGPAPQIGLGCNLSSTGAAVTAIINDTGAVLKSFPNLGGGDEIWFNPGNNHYLFANRQDTVPGFGPALTVIDAASLTAQIAFTGAASNAHSVAADPVFNRAFVPVSSASTSKLCSSQGAVDTNGCILLYTPNPRTPEPGCYTSSALGDVDANATADFLWRRVTDGRVTLWEMNGTNPTATDLGLVGTDWNIVGFGDINGDGKGDILWRNNNGAVAIWFMNGATITSSVALGTVGTEWHIAGVRDFDGDGKADILWRNNNGSVAIWLMNGATIVSSVTLGTVGLEWQIFGTGDFNGDGKGDILWRNLNGTVAIWLMNGTTLASSTALGLVGTDWTIAGIGDVNADKQSDIVWRNLNGSIAIWLMTGGKLASSTSVANPSTDFIVAGVGDLNGDGKADITFRGNTGPVLIWLMSSTVITSATNIFTVGNDEHLCQEELGGPF